VRFGVVQATVAPPDGEGQNLNNLRNLALWIVIALLLVFLFNLFQGTGSHTTASALTYSNSPNWWSRTR